MMSNLQYNVLEAILVHVQYSTDNEINQQMRNISAMGISYHVLPFAWIL